MKINEVAKLSGVTVRTLHYYDEIGLLKPRRVTEAGYRVYDKESLQKLQQILFFRELDFSLKDIKEIMLNPNYDKGEALKNQRDLITKKRDRLNRLIKLLNKSIEGDKNMSFKEFDVTEIEQAKNKYAKEVKERYGKTDAYKEYAEKSKGYDKNKWDNIMKSCDGIMAEFAENMDKKYDSKEVQELVCKWQKYITDNFYECTKQILSCLGMMYVGDERFKNNIDKHSVGTAQFISQAIAIYCRK